MGGLYEEFKALFFSILGSAIPLIWKLKNHNLLRTFQLRDHWIQGNDRILSITRMTDYSFSIYFLFGLVLLILLEIQCW